MVWYNWNVDKLEFGRKDVVMKKNSSKTLGIIILIIFIIVALKMCSEPSPSEKFYQEYKQEIDSYNERHKDDWKGYKGTRRYSMAEDEKFRQDGIDAEEYRSKNGY